MRQKQVMPDAEESIKFGSGLRNNPVDYDRNAEWIMTVEIGLGCVTQQGGLILTSLTLQGLGRGVDYVAFELLFR